MDIFYPKNTKNFELLKLPKSWKFKKIRRFWIKEVPFTQNFAKQPNIFLFPKFLELFFTPKKTPPKVKNSKPDKRDIFFGQPVYLHHFSIFHQKCICIWSHCFTFCPISFSSYFPISESEVFILNFMQSSTHITIISGFNLFPAISHARLFSHSSIVHNNSSPLAARQ